MTAPIASGWSGAGWRLHPLESAALSRRTPKADSLPMSTSHFHGRSVGRNQRRQIAHRQKAFVRIS
jgi:hypothetical protein